MNIKYLDHVAAAKNDLQLWFSSFEQKYRGIKMFSNINKIGRKDTDFAKWYYGEGQLFSSFDSFRILENSYNNMYDFFLKYEDLNNQPIKKSLFFNSNAKRKIELKNIFQNVKRQVDELIKNINTFEKKLRDSPLFEIASEEKEETMEKIIPTNEEPLDFGNLFKDKVKQSKEEEVEEEVKESESFKKQEKTRITLPKVDTKDKTSSNKDNQKIQKPILKPDKKTNTEYLDLDIEEEIRRILS